MMATITTETYPYTKTRINVIDDHVELFLRCAGLSDENIDKMLDAVDRQELEAIGAYIEENGYRVAEVELEINWETYKDQVNLFGNLFDIELPGWKNGVAPEAYVAVSRLAKNAKNVGVGVRTWIRVSAQIRNNTAEHKRVCDNLGYSFGGKMSPWKVSPTTQSRKVEGMPEISVTSRISKE